MKYQGFEVYPIGKAKINITENDILVVEGMSQSGIDGIIVYTDTKDSYQIDMNPIEDVRRGGVVKFSTLGKNRLNQCAVMEESYKWLDIDTNKINFGENMAFLPKRYNLFGRLNGQEVFNIEQENPIYDEEPPPPPPIAWIPVLTLVVATATLAVAVYDTLKTKRIVSHVTKYDAQRNVIGYERIVTTDPVPFEVTVLDQTYLVDEVGYLFDETFDPIPEDRANIMRTNAVMIQGFNIGKIEITGIK